MGCIIGVARNSRLQEAVSRKESALKRKYLATSIKHRQIGRFSYAAFALKDIC